MLYTLKFNVGRTFSTVQKTWRRFVIRIIVKGEFQPYHVDNAGCLLKIRHETH